MGEPREKLYKVLVDGKNCHGGIMSWSLPSEDGTPGDWHEVDGPTTLCHHGFHLTHDPVQWWKPRCEVYEAEAEDLGESDAAKIVVRKVRLLRRLDDEELAALRIFRSGQREARDAEKYIASGSARVLAMDSAQVQVLDSAQVKASDSAHVAAAYTATVVVHQGEPKVTLYEGAAKVDWRSGRARFFRGKRPVADFEAIRAKAMDLDHG